MASVLITGGAGFLGCHAVEELLGHGHSVAVLDNMSRARPWCVEKLERLGVEIVVGRAGDSRALARLRGFEHVIHMAALTDVRESISRPSEYLRNNVLETARLAEWALRRGVRLFTFISSASVYGEPVRIPVDEDHPLAPLSPYGASKAAGELLIRSLGASRGLRFSIARPFNIYGPGQSGSYAGVISKFAERILSGKPPIIYGDGLQERDFVYVEDVARALRMIVEAEPAGAVYNIGSGRGVSIRDLARIMIALAGSKVKPIHKPARRGEIRVSVASIQRISRDLGWRPSTGIEEGLEKLLSQLRLQLHSGATRPSQFR